jgi:hypothetical protein
MSKETEKIDLGFDEVTSLRELRSKGIGVPMVTTSFSPDVIKIASPSKHALTSVVKVSDLLIDYSYQRQQSKSKVAKIARNFNYDALGVIIVSIRESGDMFVLDGGHRVAAMNLLGKSDENINALVYFDLTLKQEASLFISLNEERTKPKRFDIHTASSSAGEVTAVEMDTLLENNNLRFSDVNGYGCVRAVGTVRKMIEKIGSDKLDRVLKILVLANGNHSKFLCSEYIVACSAIVCQYPNIKDDRLAKAFNSLGEPSIAVMKSNSMASGKSAFSKVQSLCSVIIDNYNYKMTKNRLDKNIILLSDARTYLYKG